MKKRTKMRSLVNWKVRVHSVLFSCYTEGLTHPKEEEEDEDQDGPADSDAPRMAPGRNSQLTVGYKGDRSYVLRGNSIGVFNRKDDHSVGYYGTISSITDTKGKSFNPSHVRPFLFPLINHVTQILIVLAHPTDHAARAR